MVALALVVATAQLYEQPPAGIQFWGPVLVVALLIQRRWPLAAVVLAGAGVAAHLVGPDIKLVPLDVALPITVFTLASGVRRRRTGLVVLAVLLVGVFAGSLVNTALRPPDYPVDPAWAIKYDCPPGEKPHAKLGCVAPGIPPEELEARMAALEGIRKERKAAAPAEPVPPPQPKVPFQESRPSVRVLTLHALGNALLPMLVLGLALAFGDSVRSRRAHLRTLEQRAADLEREQHQRTALAAAAERARITRELHDVVAHGVSVMVVQAQGGAAALERHPDRTAAALQNVIMTGRASLTEMRRLLGEVNRDPAGDPQLVPQPGLGALPALVDQVRAAGTPVRLVIDGVPAPLPATVDLSAYRIVQEALTNTIKHAGPATTAVIRLAFEPSWLEIDVSDDGIGGLPPDNGDGNGLRGIAQRVDILGGQLAVGPAKGGGFRVWALLPLQPAELQT